MKKLTALLLALLMAFTCVAAFAETAEPAAPAEPAAAAKAVTIRNTAEINIEAANDLLTGFGVKADALEVIDKVLNVVNAVNEQLIYDENGFQYDLMLNDTAVMSLAGEATDDGLVFASSLAPNYAFSLSAYTIASMIEEAEASVDEEELTDLMYQISAASASVQTYYAEYIKKVLASIFPGETETGEYHFAGEGVFEKVDITFNSKMPYTIDMKAIVDATNELQAAVLSDEAVWDLLASLTWLGVNININEDDIEPIPDDQIPEVTLDVYYNANDKGEAIDDEVYYDFDIAYPAAKGEEPTKVYFDMLMHDAAHMDMRLTIPDLQSSLTFTYGMVANGDELPGWSAVLDLMGTHFAFVNTTDEDSEAGKLEITNKFYAIDTERPIFVGKTSGVKEGTRTMEVAGKDKTILALEDVTSGEADLTGVLMDVMFNGLGSLVGAATEAVPEFAELLTLFNGEEKAEEAPAEAAEAAPEAEKAA